MNMKKNYKLVKAYDCFHLIREKDDAVADIRTDQEYAAFIAKACETHDELLEFYNASTVLTATLGHPEATVEDERKAEQRYDAAVKAVRTILAG